MPIEITGPKRRQPWRGAMYALVIAGIVGAIGLILLGLIGGIPGRLALVFLGRLFAGLLDIHRRRSGSFCRRLPCDRHHRVGKRIARITLCPAT
jgi:hypothetical protein